MEQNNLEERMLGLLDQISNTHTIEVKNLLKEFYSLAEQYRKQHGEYFNVTDARRRLHETKVR